MRTTRVASPRKLLRGDTVTVVATAFAIAPSPLRAGVERLRRMGFRVRCGPHVLKRSGYLAGEDDDRLADLNRALRDPDNGAIWFARGGYGTARLLPRVDWAALRRNRPLLIGYSDLTALFAAALRRTPAVCLHGPMIADLADPSRYDPRSLRAMLRGDAVEVRVRRGQVWRKGEIAGRVAGGNLTTLVHALGTRYAPDFRERVVFLEEVGEESYRLDRMLTQLLQSGAMRGVRGILLGSFATPPATRRFPPDRPDVEVLREMLLPLGVPLVAGLPFGHVGRRRTFALGGFVRTADRGRALRFEPGPAA